MFFRAKLTFVQNLEKEQALNESLFLSMDELLLLSSPQLHLLARTMNEYLSELVKAETNPSNSIPFPSNICGLVFTRHATVAKVVSAWLGELASIASRSTTGQAKKTPKENVFSFLRPDHVLTLTKADSLDNVHHERSAQSLHTQTYLYQKQKEVLQRFRSSNDCNILVTTSAYSDELDVSTCNLVICLDVPQSFSQFIQAKGRVRVDRGLFVVMVPAPKHRPPLLIDLGTEEVDHRTDSYVARFMQFIEKEKAFSTLRPVNHDVSIEDYSSQFKLFDSRKECICIDASLVLMANESVALPGSTCQPRANLPLVDIEFDQYIDKFSLQDCLIPNTVLANQDQAGLAQNAEYKSKYKIPFARKDAVSQYDKKVPSPLQGVCFKKVSVQN